MKTSSAKAKGRRLQKWAADQVAMIILGRPSEGKDDFVASREMGQSGSDVRIVGAENWRRFPFVIECKNSEHWDLPAAIRQAQANRRSVTKKGCEIGNPLPDTSIQWMVVLSKNRNNRPVVVMDAELTFLIIEAAAHRYDETHPGHLWDYVAWLMDEHAKALSGKRDIE